MHLLYSRFFVKAMRDMGVFADTEAAMRAHGRSPYDAFDEPFRVLRNQGQVLGAEHDGDVVAVEGRRDGARIIASRVTVVTGATAPQGAMVGEIMRRTENLLQVMVDGELISVEVPDDAPVIVPGIAGTNDVSQLRHHLEIERMSKSKGNVVNPDELVDAYGADTVRTYLMFAFEWQKGGPWDGRGILGAHRFLEDVWKIAHLDYQPGETDDQATAALRRAVHQTIDKVDGDLADFKWNTAIAALMSLRNVMLDANKTPVVSAGAWAEAVEVLVKLLAPIAPHLTEELWRNRLGNADSVHVQPFPESDPTVAKNVQVTMVVQVNGKVRDRIEVPADISQEDAEATALASPRIAERVGALTVRRVIVRQPNLVNVVAN
jgi:leucyl-tRNA synthetase